MVRRIGPAPRKLGIHEQRVRLRREWPSFESEIRDGRLIGRGDISPGPMMDQYRVRLEYKVGSSPKVFVEQPQLHRRTPTERIPHTYPGDRPCVFDPLGADWSPDQSIGRMVDWLLLWLAYYELWLATGVWKGGGRHPKGQNK